MTDQQNTVADYDGMIIQKEIELLALNRVVLDFLDIEHKFKDIKPIQSDVRMSNIEIDEILRSVLKDNKLFSEYRNEADELCKRCRSLKDYTKDMSKALADDYADLKKDADNNKFDVLKEIGALLAVPAAFIGFVKSGVGNDAISASQAAGAGFLISVPIFARKKIPTAFKVAAKTICGTPKEIRDSFLLYYIKERTKECGRNTRRILGRSTGSPPAAPEI